MNDLVANYGAEVLKKLVLSKKANGTVGGLAVVAGLPKTLMAQGLSEQSAVYLTVAAVVLVAAWLFSQGLSDQGKEGVKSSLEGATKDEVQKIMAAIMLRAQEEMNANKVAVTDKGTGQSPN